jgi:hypothetical protein
MNFLQGRSQRRIGAVRCPVSSALVSCFYALSDLSAAPSTNPTLALRAVRYRKALYRIDDWHLVTRVASERYGTVRHCTTLLLHHSVMPDARQPSHLSKEIALHASARLHAWSALFYCCMYYMDVAPPSPHYHALILLSPTDWTCPWSSVRCTVWSRSGWE